MRIPGNVVRQSHLTTYGAGGIELFPGHEVPGCPALYKAKYVDVASMPEPTRFELEYGLTIHDALFRMEEDVMTPDEALKAAWHTGLSVERYDEALKDLEHAIEKGGILPMLSTLDVEVELTAPLYEDEDFGPIEIGGRLDGVWINANDMDTLYVGDYKTDRSPPSRDKLKGWTQGRHYAFLARANANRWLEGTPRIVVLYEAVKWSTLDIEYTEEELDAYGAWAEAVARKILRDKTGRPKLNSNCTWCPIRQTCKEWKKLPKIGTTLAEKVSGVPLEEQVVMMKEAQAVRGKLDKMIKDVKATLEEKIKVDGPFRSPELGKEWTLEEGLKKTFDLRLLHQIMGDDFYDVIGIGIGKLGEWTDRNLDFEANVRKATTYEPSGTLSMKEKSWDG